MEFKDKYHLTTEQNRRYAKTNLARLVFTNTRLSGLDVTLSQVETIVFGLKADGVSLKDVNTIIQLKRGWQYIINEKRSLSLSVEKNINMIVTGDSALLSGKLNAENEEKYLNDLINSDRSATDKALTLMFHNMRQQIFWDGNKRSAILAANKLMIENGAGLIAVPEDKYPTFLRKISDYYLSNDMKEVKEWTYKNGIQGIELKQGKSSNTEIDPNLKKYLE